MSDSRAPKRSGPSLSSFWFGPKLTWVELLSLSSAAALSSQVTLYSYSGEGEKLDRVANRDARIVLPRSQVFENPRQPGTFAGFSNIFRYELIANRDEIWFDLDVVFTDWSVPSSGYVMGYENSKGTVNGAVLGAPIGSAFSRKLQEKSRLIDRSKLRWGQLGPSLITECVKELDLWSHVLPREKFYAIPPESIWRLWAPSEKDSLVLATQESAAIHLWNEVLRTVAPEIRQFQPARSSFLGELIHRYGIDVDLPEIGPDWAENVFRKRLESINSPKSRLARRIKQLVVRGRSSHRK